MEENTQQELIQPPMQATEQQKEPQVQQQPTDNNVSPDKTEKILSAFGYIGFLCVLPLILKRESKYCQHHGKQGLVLAVIETILRLFTFWTGFYSFILFVLYLIVIYAMIKAYKGEYVTLPLISDIAKEIKL